MAGGAPAGMIRLLGEVLCLATSIIIKNVTIRGKNNTTPRGTDILELPLKRIRLLKNDNLVVGCCFSLVTSSKDGKLGDEGSCLIKSRTTPMVARFPCELNQNKVLDTIRSIR